jgi:transposase-like protein
MKWQDMTGEERYRVVELARKGEQSIQKICETFGVSRQSLRRAINAAEQGAMAALAPKKRGRKSKSEQEQRAEELAKQNASLSKQVAHWKKRYDVAQSFIELQRESQDKSELDERRRARNRRKRDRRASKKKPRSSA